jgi:hypothetical protein
MSGIPENESAPTPPASDPAAEVAADVPATPAAPLPPENVVRGALLSLLVVPAGILVFVLIWNLGFIASIVGFGVAFGAFFLYRLGSGGRISMRGAVVVTVVTLVTLVLSFLAAELFTLAGEIARVNDVSVPEVLTSPQLREILSRAFASPEVAGALAGDAAMTLLFGAIGCFTVLRGAFREAKAAVL